MSISYDYHNDLLSVSSSGSSSGRRFFRPTSLGRPPGLTKPATYSVPPPINTTRSSSSSSNSSYDYQQTPSVGGHNNKTAPFKELQKMIADLKKENFDLKLRLFHTNWLEQENERLASALDDMSHRQKQSAARSVGTQTLFVDVSPTTTTYYTAFETSPEAFGLTPHRATPLLSSDQVDSSVERVADAFSTVRIVSSSPDPIRGWLEETQKVEQSPQPNVSPLLLLQKDSVDQRSIASL
ncbi:hypothetical protein BDB00DRAFT_855674 [Zychaea mexicana]|uniref:uncharacterized protein n=1 Tax=Zychaea mexicana TaxID=64656 RepID=UPI0022FEC713|nr:uncharacterized protein BDB00DRAFT_855674 [Zychaea mexicana]KAI9484430.1 hypothetical protein BDB00DRAFT_855674 [Zychaea mexicana]